MVKQLTKAIVAACMFFVVTSANAFEVTLKVAVDDPAHPAVVGVSNLPDNTKLMITLVRRESRYSAQSEATVIGGHFRSSRFSQGGAQLNPGTYQVQVMMPLPGVQPPDVQAIIGRQGEKLSGPLVRRDKLGVVVETRTTFTVGKGSDPKLDAAAREKAAKEFDEWVVKTCKETVDLANAMVRKGLVTGHEYSGAEKDKKISECLSELRKNK